MSPEVVKMADDFLIYNEEEYPLSQLEEDKKDFQRVQILRGRFIHYMSLLELIMKEYCELDGSNLNLREVLPLFIDELKENFPVQDDELKKFRKNIEKINHQRNKWAHAIIWYKKRKVKDTPNNFLGGNTNLNKYFDKIIERFNEIFKFLNRYSLIKLKGEKKLFSYSIRDDLYNPVIF